MPLTQVQPGMLGTPQPYNFKNRLINGAQVIDQRNAGTAVSVTGNNQFVTDRWAGYNSSEGIFSLQQVSDAPAGFVNSLKATITTADASIGATQYSLVRQRIEGYNIADLNWGSSNAKTITFSFWVKSSLTGTFGGVLLNGSNDRSYPYTYTILAANTWEQKSITIAGDTSGTWLTTNGIGIQVDWNLAVGSTYSGTAGAWAATLYLGATGETQVLSTLNATIQWTGAQFEVGVSATTFDYRPYTTELQLCQRYYEETSNNRSVEFQIHAITNGLNSTRFQVRKRTAPTVVVYSSNTGVANTVNNGNGNVQTSISGYASYPDCFAVQMAGTTSQMYTYFFTASAEL